MSKSKRVAVEEVEVSSGPQRMKRGFTDGSGGLRTGWLLAVSLLSYAIVALAARYGLVRAFAALFGAWGVNADNVLSAPGWARALYVWHGSVATLAFAALTLGLCGGLSRLWHLRIGRRSGKNRLKSALEGAGAALIVAALCLLPDSSRLEWPLSAPRLTWSLPLLCGISLVAVWAEESFFRGLLLEGLLQRWGRPWAWVASSAAFLLFGGGIGGTVISAVNVLLLGWLCCLLYERRGLWAAVLFRWAWSAINVFALGFGGAGASVYRLYGVSEILMTGGDGGPSYGLWTTLLFAGGIAMAVFGHRKADRAS